MAGAKVTTTADVVDVQQPASKDDAKYTKVVSPWGMTTTVPVEIKDALIESGYTAGK